MASDIYTRKDEHIEIAASGRGAFQNSTTLLEEVHLVHQALPEIGMDQVDLSIDLFGKKLYAPLLIGSMTGGTESAARINEKLAQTAESLGIGFCLGSQRVMSEDPASEASFQVRKFASDILLVGNLGLVQAKQIGCAGVKELVDSVGADAMSLHMNPAHELTQANGDRDFRGCREVLNEMAAKLPVPVIFKETGCGISRETGESIVEAGVKYVDIGGSGGTSWVRVEAERNPKRRWIGDLLAEWGIPTAASLIMLDNLPLVRIAGGGIRDAHDLARALALGAKACTIAQPVLAAYKRGGTEGARRYLMELMDGLRAICLLTGCKKIEDLAKVPRITGPNLRQWQENNSRG